MIQTDLSSRSLNTAIKQVAKYKRQLVNRADTLVAALVGYGVEFAKMELAELDGVEGGSLMSRIEGYFDVDSHAGFIRAGSPYAVYVEFGTGVIGKSHKHLQADKQGWIYDINDHGEAGWVYWDEYVGGFRWTKGQKSRSFMMNTVSELHLECERLAREVFNR